MSYIGSWSGGKDSCFACYRAMCRGYDISYLVNFISKKYKRVSFHGTESKLIQLQAEALGLPLLQKETTGNGYEQEFKEAVRSLIPKGIKGMILAIFICKNTRIGWRGSVESWELRQLSHCGEKNQKEFYLTL